MFKFTSVESRDSTQTDDTLTTVSQYVTNMQIYTMYVCTYLEDDESHYSNENDDKVNFLCMSMENGKGGSKQSNNPNKKNDLKQEIS